jgi:hypothetical protein
MKAALARRELAALAALFALLAWQVLAGPLTGLADSGDFERVLGWGGLAFQPPPIGWITPRFAFDRAPLWAHGDYLTSEALFVKLAACLARPFGQAMDLRVLGMVHATAFVGAIAVLMAGWKAAFRRSALWLVPALALVLCDNAYVVYFNSLYSEAATLVFLPMLLGTGLLLASKAQPSHAHLLAFFAAAIGFTMAKMQNVTMALPLLLFAGWLFAVHREARVRRGLVLGCVALLATAGTQVALNPAYMTRCNQYSAVFNGVLRDSPTPRDDLDALGLDPGYATLAGTDFFMADLPVDVNGEAFRRGFFERVSHAAVLRFYLTRPARLTYQLDAAARRGFMLRPDYLGNFTRATGLPAATKSDRYSLWSRFKRDRLPHTLPLVLGWGLALAAWLLAALWRAERTDRSRAIFLLAGLAMLAIAFATPVLGDGQNDLDKHMFLFNLLFDLSGTLATAYGLATARSSLRGRRPRVIESVAWT